MAPLKPNPNKGIVKVQNSHNPTFFAMLGATKLSVGKKTPGTTASRATSAASKPTSSIAGADAALANLKHSLAIENQKKAELS